MDSHGWGTLYSARLSWQLGHRWVHELRVNRVGATHAPATLGVLYGLGYELDSDDGEDDDAAPRGYQLSALTGATIRNSFSSETSFAKSVELRRATSGRFEWTVAWLDEGSRGPLARDGFTAQGWLVRRWHDGDTTLALGAGAYAILDTFGDQRRDTRHLAGYASLSASQRFAPRWRGRLSFSRVIGTHPFDSDVLLVGTSYEL
jgi:hypothetical protein